MTAAPVHDDAEQAAGGQPPRDFAARLVAWQRAHGRHDLPWQTDREPYRVWLSEIMLQQTQVSVVGPYFERFLQRFPTLAELAAADIDDVLALWSGLGYYRRARNLHLCARQVVERHGGVFPRRRDAIEELAGIGRSTAAAIAAFCFGERAAILDGNVRRVLGRAFGLAPDARPRELWALAESLLPGSVADIGAYTQGLMDLGATVCRPRNPECARCPFAADCAAPGATPPRTPRAARRLEHWVLLLPRSEGGLLWLERRDAHGIWPGLWCPPRCADRDAALAQAASLGRVVAARDLPPRRHVLTHLDLELQPVLVDLAESALAADGAAGWFSPEQALDLGLPAPLRTLLREL